ncbi:MAG: protoheme IX farnesyltransferase [SAR202 cluster bacterium]|nr:protoheme IX farnesyltransferase [SAR202 cluster bacterium]
MPENSVADQSTLAGSGSPLGLLKDYLALTKPPIIVLLLVTAAGGMFLAAQGVPSVLLMALVGLGGALASGGANALNHYLDRDIDGVMRRTRRRPVPGQRIGPTQALAFGVTLNVVAFVLLAVWVNLLAAVLTLSATLFYVFVYTWWLKRNTPQNIVIGGAAGAIPPLVGWAAVTGGLDLPAVYLFAIVFFWTPPHFWALSLLIQEDYREAGIPMLPVVVSRRDTILHILLYTIALVAITLMFFFTKAVGWVYASSAAALGAWFLWLAWRLFREDTRSRARWLYLYSLLYLALLFAAMMVDSSLDL